MVLPVERQLAPILARLRGQMASAPRPVDWTFVYLDRDRRATHPDDLPYRWRRLLDDPTVRPDVTEPVIAAAGDVTEIASGGQRPPGGIAVLSARELIIAKEPGDWTGPDRYGVDTLTVPRDKLRGLRWDGTTLHVLLNDVEPSGRATIALSVEPFLPQAAREAFGDAVAWF